MKILVDAMYDGWDEKLQKYGYDAYSVKKLQKEEETLGHDFNIIQLAQKEDMVLITSDTENGKACNANKISCIFISQESIINKIVIPELELHRKSSL